MKKLTRLMLAAIVVGSMLVGCGGNEEVLENEVSNVNVASEEAVEVEENSTVEAETEKAEEEVVETEEVVDFGQSAGEVVHLDMADIQVLNIDSSGEEMILTMAIKNIGAEVLEVKPSLFYIENVNKTEEEPDDYDWSLFPTENEFLSDIRLVPGGMMIGIIGFESTPDVSNTLLISKTMDSWDGEFVRVDLTTEVSALTLEATPDASILETSTHGVGESFIPVEEVAEVTVVSGEFVDETKLTMDGQVNVRVDYSIKNVGDTVVNCGFLEFGVFDYSTGIIRKQGTYPVLDDEMWIYSVEEGQTADFFMCYQVNEGAKCAVIFNDPWEDDYSMVPIN